MKFVLFVTLIWSILDSGWSITDEDLMRIEAGLTQIQVLTREMAEVKAGNKQMKRENDKIRTENVQLREREEELTQRVARLEQMCGVDNEKDPALNTTIEERVSLLELQMTEVQDDVVNIEEDVDLINDQQVVQDQRIFSVEQDMSDHDDRIETVEETSDSHSNRITSVENQIEDLDSEINELEARLVAAETEIEDLQATDVDLDSRISDLEEETIIIFRAVTVEDNTNIPIDSTMIFSDVQLNLGNGYDAATGIFTVPSGGEGYYYFATHFTVMNYRFVRIDIRVNDVAVCTMRDDNDDDVNSSNGGCNAVVFLSEGDEVKNVYWFGEDSYPVWEHSSGIYNGFTGFRIKM